jgi:hypothetical protein
MKFIALIYTDESLLGQLSPQEFNQMMRGCIEHADDLRDEGRLIDSQILGPAKTAKSVRVRNGKQTIHDGPFAETKEIIAGFNVIEAEDMDEAVRIGASFPWTRTGCIEIRPLDDFEVIRKQVGASPRGA